MKRIFLVIAIMSLIVCSVYSQSSYTGKILEINGNVDLKPAGSSSFVKAGVGDEIALDTIVSTGFRSIAVIAAGNSIITVQPLSQLSLSENNNINLQTGKIKIEPTAGTQTIFTVHSPGTNSFVRGTSFEYDTVNMKANEGRVLFSGISGPAVVVQEGREDALGADKKPSGSSASCSLPSAPGGSRGSSSSKSGGGGAGGGGGGASGGGGSCCD